MGRSSVEVPTCLQLPQLGWQCSWLAGCNGAPFTALSHSLARPPPPLAGNINSNGTGQFAGQPRFKVGSWPRRAAILPVLWHVPAERHSELCLVLPCADLLNPVCASFCCCRPAPRWWSSSKRRTCSAARWTTPCAWASARGEFGQSAGLHQRLRAMPSCFHALGLLQSCAPLGGCNMCILCASLPSPPQLQGRD